MQTTSISWADYSWNPPTGCSKIGPECVNCYAESFSLRQGRTDLPWTHENAGENVTMHWSRLDEPFCYSFPEGPGRVFVGSMTDMFHREIYPMFNRIVLDVCRKHPEHLWIFLTKRPEVASERDLDWPENTILGTSVGSGPGGEYPDTTHRIKRLREVEGVRKWVSFEPLIERVGPVDLTGIDWIVVGGESAPADDRREMDHDWARELLEQARIYDVPFFYKQDSGRFPETNPVLSVPKEVGGSLFYEQRRFREGPPLPDAVQEAREGVA